MGLFDSIDSLFGSAVSDISSIFGGGLATSGSYLGGLDTGVQPFPMSYMPTYGFEQPSAPPAVMTAAAMPPAVMTMARGLQAFPALALALAKFRAMRIPMTVEKMWSMVRRFGPQAISAFGGGIITADVISQLMTYKATHKRRRMNVANTKALRRGLRRLKGFERLSHRVSAQLGRAARSGRSARRGRCMTCRKSPCMC